jgi:hypothetical protein
MFLYKIVISSPDGFTVGTVVTCSVLAELPSHPPHVT